MASTRKLRKAAAARQKKWRKRQEEKGLSARTLWVRPPSEEMQNIGYTKLLPVWVTDEILDEIELVTGATQEPVYGLQREIIGGSPKFWLSTLGENLKTVSKQAAESQQEKPQEIRTQGNPDQCHAEDKSTVEVVPEVPCSKE